MPNPIKDTTDFGLGQIDNNDIKTGTLSGFQKLLLNSTIKDTTDFGLDQIDLTEKKDTLTPSNQGDILSDEQIRNFTIQTQREFQRAKQSKDELNAYEKTQPFMLAEAAQSSGILGPIEHLMKTGERSAKNFGEGKVGSGIADIINGLIQGTAFPFTVPLSVGEQASRELLGNEATNTVGEVLNLPFTATKAAREGLGVDLGTSGNELTDLLGGLLITGGVIKGLKGGFKLSKDFIKGEKTKGISSENQNIKTSEIPTKQGKSVIEQPKSKVKEGTPQPEGNNPPQTKPIGKVKEVPVKPKIEKPAGEKQNFPEGTPNPTKATKADLSEPQLKSLKRKTVAQFGEGTLLNSDKLGKYKNDDLNTSKVISKLKQYGLLDEVKKIHDSFTLKSRNPIVKGSEFEALSRIMLKNFEEMKLKPEGKKAPKIEPVKSLDEYKSFKDKFNKTEFTQQELTDQLFGLNDKLTKTNTSKNPYLFRQTMDIAKELSKKIDGKITVDSKDLWLETKRIKSKEEFEALTKQEVSKPVSTLTAEGAKRKAEAEKLQKGANKLIAENKPSKNIYEAMRDNEIYTVDNIASVTNISKQKIAENLRDLTTNKLIERTEKGFKPTEEFKVLLDDMVKNPKNYQSDLGKLYSNPIPEVLKGISKASTFLDDVFEKALGRPIYNKLAKTLNKIVPEKIKEQIVTNYGLPKEYTVLRSNAKDAISRYNELAKELGNNLLLKDNKTKFTVAEQKRLTQIIKGSITNNPILKDRAYKAIAEINQLETLGKELETLPIETYNTKLPRKRINELLNEKRKLESNLEKVKNIGDKTRAKQIGQKINILDKKIKGSFKHGGEGYFKRIFLSKEQSKMFQRYGYYKPTRLDLTSAIARKDIPFEVRKEMGEVLTASYPVSKGIILEGKDVSLGNFFKAISEHPDWVSPEEGPGFVQMPNSPKLGKLKNQFVEERIANDINDIVRLTSPEYLDGFLKEVNSIWKATKTIMNPSTHFRNIMSNSIMLDFSGVSQLEQTRILPKAIQAIKGKGEYAAELKASRLNSTTFAKEELGKFLDIVAGKKNWANLSIADKALKAYGKASLVDTKVGEFLGKLYQTEETIGKAVKFIAEREKGKTIAEARVEANKWLFDYGETPKVVNFLRTNPFLGIPFITWSYKAFPRIIETAITRPISFWKYPVIISALSKYSLSKINLLQDEWDKIKAGFPERIAQGEWLLLPFRDANGKMQMLDLTYIMPYKDGYDLAMSGYTLATQGKFNDGKNIVEGVVGMIDAPITTTISELMSNKNTYSGYPIYNEIDTPAEQMIKVLDYLYKLYMPSLAPEIPGITKGGYAWHKLSSTIKHNEDYYGRNFTLAPAIGSSIFGLKTTPIDIKRNKERKYYKLQEKQIEFSKKKNRILRDPTINREEKIAKAKEIILEINKIKLEKKKLGVK